MLSCGSFWTLMDQVTDCIKKILLILYKWIKKRTTIMIFFEIHVFWNCGTPRNTILKIQKKKKMRQTGRPTEIFSICVTYFTSKILVVHVHVKSFERQFKFYFISSCFRVWKTHSEWGRKVIPKRKGSNKQWASRYEKKILRHTSV